MMGYYINGQWQPDANEIASGEYVRREEEVTKDKADKYFRDADLARIRELEQRLHEVSLDWQIKDNRIRELEAELAALRQQQGEPALKRFEEHGGYREQDPIERLRFFCSLAMNGQDWMDVEPFFDALRQQQGEPVAVVKEDPYDYGTVIESTGVVNLQPGTKLYREAAPRVPEGWKLVPVEPTEEMAKEYWAFNDRTDVVMADAWNALLAAAPEPKE